MTRSERLRREARESATWRGHALGRFARGTYWRDVFFAECTRTGCTAGVSVDPSPPPNGIDIGGRAVALNCPDAGDGSNA